MYLCQWVHVYICSHKWHLLMSSIDVEYHWYHSRNYILYIYTEFYVISYISFVWYHCVYVAIHYFRNDEIKLFNQWNTIVWFSFCSILKDTDKLGTDSMAHTRFGFVNPFTTHYLWEHTLTQDNYDIAKMNLISWLTHSYNELVYQFNSTVNSIFYDTQMLLALKSSKTWQNRLIPICKKNSTRWWIFRKNRNVNSVSKTDFCNVCNARENGLIWNYK